MANRFFTKKELAFLVHKAGGPRRLVAAAEAAHVKTVVNRINPSERKTAFTSMAARVTIRELSRTNVLEIDVDPLPLASIYKLLGKPHPLKVAREKIRDLYTDAKPVADITGRQIRRLSKKLAPYATLLEPPHRAATRAAAACSAPRR